MAVSAYVLPFLVFPVFPPPTDRGQFPQLLQYLTPANSDHVREVEVQKQEKHLES